MSLGRVPVGRSASRLVAWHVTVELAMFDYLVVGAGLSGATFARRAADAGKRCLVVEADTHVAGHCYTEEVEGIQVHAFGPHIFHTDSERVWRFVNRFAAFNSFRYRPRVQHRGRIYSFPINLLTLYQLWGVRTPAEARARLERERVACARPRNAEEWLLSQLGPELYKTFYAEYTLKQWGRPPADLPASIVRRVPIRLTFDDDYFADRYQGIPLGGYTNMVSKMLGGIEVRLACDYLREQARLDALARKILYTGPLDGLFGCRYGRLEYRSLRFEREVMEGDFQGVAVVNHTSAEVPYTRTVEHKHFENPGSAVTVLTREYPQPPSPLARPFYPVGDARNLALARKYAALADASGILLCGRLASYRYYDMHQVIGQALALADREGLKPE
jgi:UDP-galactopyranose mutase